MNKKIKVQGEKWKIKTIPLSDDSGLTDVSIRTIFIDSGLYEKNDDVHEVDDKSVIRRKTTRHELIHALMYECGMYNNDEEHNERIVDWIALMYPKMKKMFEELEIEK